MYVRQLQYTLNSASVPLPATLPSVYVAELAADNDDQEGSLIML
jgi:hypothetical protein